MKREVNNDLFNNNICKINEQIDIYRELMEESHRLANEAREYGLDEESDYIQGLQKQWWQYFETQRQLQEELYNNWFDERQYSVKIMERNEVDKREIIAHWRETITGIEEELEKLANKTDKHSSNLDS